MAAAQRRDVPHMAAAQRRDVPHKQSYQHLNTSYHRVAYFVKFRNCPKKDIASAVLRAWKCCSLYFMVSFQLSFSFQHKICWTAVKFVSSLYCKDRKQFRSVGQSSCYTRVSKNCLLAFVNFQFWNTVQVNKHLSGSQISLLYSNPCLQ